MRAVEVSREAAASALVYLRGHGTVPAHLEVSRFPLLVWMGRIAAFAVLWLGGSALTVVLTFDPFVASFPFVLGMATVYRAVRGRYTVHAFQGACPRCRESLALTPGSRIGLPHAMTCYACHHEPELQLQP